MSAFVDGMGCVDCALLFLGLVFQRDSFTFRIVYEELINLALTSGKLSVEWYLFSCFEDVGQAGLMYFRQNSVFTTDTE